MTETDLTSLDGAELIVAEEHGLTQYLIAWFGGTTFNVYVQTGDSEKPLDERTMFSLSDENGEPVSRERAESHAREWLKETLEEQQ